jgi:hypothetical protein
MAGNAGSSAAFFIQNSRYSAATSMPREPGARPSKNGLLSVMACWYHCVAIGPRSSKTLRRLRFAASTVREVSSGAQV